MELNGQIMMTYRCSAACRHCLVMAAPRQSKARGSVEDAVEYGRDFQGLGRRVIIAGGEALLFPEHVLAMVRALKDAGVPVAFVESNGSWCVSDRIVVERLTGLRDAGAIAQILGERTVLTEVASYKHLAGLIENGVLTDMRSAVIAAYGLCGFAHVAAVAIFVGGAAALVPERAADISRLGFRALIAATLACFQTAAVAGVFVGAGGGILFGSWRLRRAGRIIISA